MSAKHPTVGEVVTATIRGSFERLCEHEQELRTSDDPEAVHQARVATRRLRSDLRTFEAWLDERGAELRGELRWLGSELGAVRDLDVMRAGLREHAQVLPPPEAESAERVIRRLDADREAARTDLLANLHHARYAHLHHTLEVAATCPPLNEKAGERADAVLQPAVRHRWHKLKRAVSRLGDNPPDEALHAVRVRAKRVRYAAEAVQVVFGDDARVFAKRVARIQDVLGDQHDAVVATAWLAKTAHECSPGEAYAVGMLAQIEREHADAARAAFPDAWDGARHKRLRTWL